MLSSIVFFKTAFKNRFSPSAGGRTDGRSLPGCCRCYCRCRVKVCQSVCFSSGHRARVCQPVIRVASHVSSLVSPPRVSPRVCCCCCVLCKCVRVSASVASSLPRGVALSSFASLHSVSCPVVSPWPLVKFRSALRRRPLVSSSTLSCLVSGQFVSAPLRAVHLVVSCLVACLCSVHLVWWWVGDSAGLWPAENFWDVAGSVYVCMCVDVCMCDGVTRVRMELGVVAW